MSLPKRGWEASKQQKECTRCLAVRQTASRLHNTFHHHHYHHQEKCPTVCLECLRGTTIATLFFFSPTLFSLFHLLTASASAFTACCFTVDPHTSPKLEASALANEIPYHCSDIVLVIQCNRWLQLAESFYFSLISFSSSSTMHWFPPLKAHTEYSAENSATKFSSFFPR